MLTITGVSTFLVDGGFRPWTFARVETGDGTVGWGDCTDWGSPRPVVAMVERLAAPSVGRDPLAVEAIWWDLDAASVRHTGGSASQAMSGIDSALWDSRGKVLGAPVWQLFGGKLRDELRRYWSHFGSGRAQHAARRGRAPVATTDDRRARAEEARRRGYPAVKTNRSPLADRPDADPAAGRATGSGELSGSVRRNAEALVGTLRAAFGPDIDIALVGCQLELPPSCLIGRSYLSHSPASTRILLHRLERRTVLGAFSSWRRGGFRRIPPCARYQAASRTPPARYDVSSAPLRSKRQLVLRSGTPRERERPERRRQDRRHQHVLLEPLIIERQECVGTPHLHPALEGS
jgi:hypothetical protein